MKTGSGKRSLSLWVSQVGKDGLRIGDSTRRQARKCAEENHSGDAGSWVFGEDC